MSMEHKDFEGFGVDFGVETASENLLRHFQESQEQDSLELVLIDQKRECRMRALESLQAPPFSMTTEGFNRKMSVFRPIRKVVPSDIVPVVLPLQVVPFDKTDPNDDNCSCASTEPYIAEERAEEQLLVEEQPVEVSLPLLRTPPRILRKSFTVGVRRPGLVRLKDFELEEQGKCKRARITPILIA